MKAAAQVGQLLASTRDADRILDLIAEKCREILGAEAFGLFRFDRTACDYARGFGLDERVHATRGPRRGRGGEGRARAPIGRDRGHPADPDIELSPGDPDADRDLRLRAVVAVPIVATDRVLGVLAIYHPVGFRMPVEEREFLETLAAHAAVALENARLFAQTRRRQETAETLTALTQTLTGSLDLSDRALPGRRRRPRAARQRRRRDRPRRPGGRDPPRRARGPGGGRFATS